MSKADKAIEESPGSDGWTWVDEQVSVVPTTDDKLICSMLMYPYIWSNMRDDGNLEKILFDPLFRPGTVYLLGKMGEHVTSIFRFAAVNSHCYDVLCGVLPKVNGEHALEVSRLACRWMFENTPCIKLIAFIPTFHRPACHLAAWVGFAREGQIKHAFVSGGKVFDLEVFGLTAHGAFMKLM